MAICEIEPFVAEIPKEDLMTNGENSLQDLSSALANAAAKAGAYTVLVNARRRLPASGIAFAPDLVLTADHVVERDEDISVVLPDGREVTASVAGRDPSTDLAVLRLTEATAQAAEIVPDEAGVGQIVLAIGRPTTEGTQASLGIVSAVGGPVRIQRGGSLERYIRTDAIPYPGFSGGPLIDVNGRVIGINTSGLARGASLAIPASVAWQTAQVLAEQGGVKHGFLGIRSQPVDLSTDAQTALGREQSSGLLIVGIEPDSPAQAGGLMVGDIIVGLAGQPLRNPDELAARLRGVIVGQPAPVEVLRGGKAETVTVTVGEREPRAGRRHGRTRGRHWHRKHGRRHHWHGGHGRHGWPCC